MDTVGYFRIAIVRMLMAARRPCRPLGIAALVIVRRVVLTQAACSNAARLLVPYGQRRLGAEGKEHYDAEQQAQYSFLHARSSSLSSVLFARINCIKVRFAVFMYLSFRKSYTSLIYTFCCFMVYI